MNEEIVAPTGLSPEQQIRWILERLAEERGTFRVAPKPALPAIEGPWSNFAEIGEELSK